MLGSWLLLVGMFAAEAETGAGAWQDVEPQVVAQFWRRKDNSADQPSEPESNTDGEYDLPSGLYDDSLFDALDEKADNPAEAPRGVSRGTSSASKRQISPPPSASPPVSQASTRVSIPVLNAKTCDGPGNKLVLVNWSSQKCTETNASGNPKALGSCQAEALESVSEFLFESDHKLAACDQVVVFPEGVEQVSPLDVSRQHLRPFASRTAVLASRTTRVERLRWVHESLERHLATRESSYRPHSFAFQVESDLVTSKKSFKRGVQACFGANG